MSIGLVYKLKQHNTKATQFGKNGRLLPQRSSPLEHLKDNPATLCQASPALGCIKSFFPSNVLSVGKHRQLGHNHPDIFKVEESLRALLLFQIFSPIIPHTLEAFSFSANPVLDCLPLPQWTPPTYGPSQLFPSDLIRSLYQFHPWSGHLQAATNKCINRWTTKINFSPPIVLSLPLSFPLSPLKKIKNSYLATPALIYFISQILKSLSAASSLTLA